MFPSIGFMEIKVLIGVCVNVDQIEDSDDVHRVCTLLVYTLAFSMKYLDRGRSAQPEEREHSYMVAWLHTTIPPPPYTTHPPPPYTTHPPPPYTTNPPPPYTAHLPPTCTTHPPPTCTTHLPHPIPHTHPYPIPPTQLHHITPTQLHPITPTYPYPITPTYPDPIPPTHPTLYRVGWAGGSKIWCKANISPKLNYRQ